MSAIQRYMKKNYHYYLLLILPILYFLIFKYGPIYGVIIAFRKFVPGGPPYGSYWVGFRYFKMFLEDPVFWRAFKNNVILSFLSLVIFFPLPVIFALCLNELRGSLFKRFVQTTSYLPHFISVVVVVGMARQILSPHGGLVNTIIIALGGEAINFIGSPEWFRAIYIATDIWQELGWNAILYIAALSGIDQELYEAAMMDGAGRWKQTIHITIPGIMPVIIITLILRVGTLLNVAFQKVLILYSPMVYKTADVVSTYVYRMGLEQRQHSFATATGLFESIIGLTLLFMANRFARKFSETSLW